jgi:hypothetical protein
MLTDGGEVVSLSNQPRFTPPPGRFLLLIYVRDYANIIAIVRLEGLGNLKNQ